MSTPKEPEQLRHITAWSQKKNAHGPFLKPLREPLFRYAAVRKARKQRALSPSSEHLYSYVSSA